MRGHHLTLLWLVLGGETYRLNHCHNLQRGALGWRVFKQEKIEAALKQAIEERNVEALRTAVADAKAVGVDSRFIMDAEKAWRVILSGKYRYLCPWKPACPASCGCGGRVKYSNLVFNQDARKVEEAYSR
eukprot:4449096-Amphidinium_carterae.1